MSEEPQGEDAKETGPLTDRIFARYSEALVASKHFDEEFARQLVALANNEVPPKGADVEKLLKQEERLE